MKKARYLKLVNPEAAPQYHRWTTCSLEEYSRENRGVKPQSGVLEVFQQSDMLASFPAPAPFDSDWSAGYGATCDRLQVVSQPFIYPPMVIESPSASNIFSGTERSYSFFDLASLQSLSHIP